MKFVIVKDGLNVVGKDFFAGDAEVYTQLIAENKSKNSDLSYEEVDEKVFNETPTAEVVSKDASDWKSMKTPDDKISFLARKLGLE